MILISARSWMLAILALSCGCAGIGSSSHAGTKYRRGDFVVYEYSGSFSQQSVVLREEIIAVRGPRLEIAVHATRGAEERQWVQIVTDTPENQRNNLVDELYVVADGKRTPLSNRNNVDLYRLYDWTYVVPETKNADVRHRQTDTTIGKRRFRCDVESGRNAVNKKAIKYELLECPDFLWQHARGRFWEEATGQDVWRMEVLTFGGLVPPNGPDPDAPVH